MAAIKLAAGKWPKFELQGHSDKDTALLSGWANCLVGYSQVDWVCLHLLEKPFSTKQNLHRVVLLIHVIFISILERLSLTLRGLTSNGKNETSAVCL